MALTRFFPKLRAGTYDVTSPPTPDYNCIAWAAREDDRWWWPDANGVGYWPETSPRVETLDAFVLTFEELGFEVCFSSDFERGFEKIAIFADSNGEPTHMARQLEDGRWTSKLGALEDIEHDLENLAGDQYGQVVRLLRRHTQFRTKPRISTP